ncbi:MAG: hypothetical protein AAGA30_19205, partial [Planctomycetota bacterium]
EELIDNKFSAYRPEDADRIAKVCLVHPGREQNAQVAFRLAELASEFEESPYKHWFFFCRGLAELRQGNYMDAIEWNIRSRACLTELDMDKQEQLLAASSYCVDALAYHAMNEKNRFDDAVARADETSTANISGATWINGLFFRILRREVENLEVD